MRVGRNDPCPCGSGRKYKRCCLPGEAATTAAYDAVDRERALRRLDRFCDRPELQAQRALAEGEFWAEPDRMEVGLAEDDDRAVIEASAATFEDWFALDRPGPEGLTPVEALLRAEGDRLRSAEREFLRRLAGTELRPYEVERRGAGGSVDLVDLWSGARWSVGGGNGDMDANRGDLLATRLMPGPDGATVVEADLLLYPAGARDDLVGLLEDARRRLEPRPPGGAEPVTPGTAAPALHALWLAGLPEATEQDEAVPCHHAVFHVVDVPALEAALAAHPDVAHADGRYVWRPRGGGEVEPAAFDLEDDELVVHASSPELAREARELIEAAAGPAVRYLGDLDDELDGDVADDDEAADEDGLADEDEPREVAVDWDELEQAFAGSGDEVGAYLDVRTGRVLRVPAQGGGDELSGEALDDALARGHLLPVAPASSDDEYGWMEEFAASVAEGGLRRRLTAALDAAEPFGRFAAALRTHPAERERWLAVRGARMRALVQQWLADQGIVPTTAPPAR